MWSNPSLPLLPGPIWPGVVALNRVLRMVQIELLEIQTVQTSDLCKSELLKIELFDHSTM